MSWPEAIVAVVGLACGLPFVFVTGFCAYLAFDSWQADRRLAKMLEKLP